MLTGPRPPGTEHLLKTNEAPGEPTERASIAGFVANRRVRLVEIEGHIGILQKILDGLFREREQVQRDIDDHQIISSPARRMPDDILTEIFLSCIEENLEEDGPSSLDSRGMPWCLGQVCSRWRTVAISFPRLWSTVRVIISAFDVDDARASHIKESHLATQLRRSASHDLLVLLHIHIRATNDHRPTMDPLLRALVSTASRWRCLDIQIPLPSLGAITGIKGFLQSLTTVQIRVFSSPPTPDTPMQTLFQYAPRLRTLVARPQDLRFCLFPWSQIQEYRATSYVIAGSDNAIPEPLATSHHLDLLGRITNVERSFMSCPDTLAIPPSAGLPHVQCNHLSKLILIDKLGQLLDHLTLPALTALTVYSNVASLTSFFSRPDSPSLRILRVWSTTLTDRECLDILDLLPSLQELGLNSPKVLTARFIEELTSHTFLAPVLASIVSVHPLRSSKRCKDAVGVLRSVRPHLRIISRKVDWREL